MPVPTYFAVLTIVLIAGLAVNLFFRALYLRYHQPETADEIHFVTTTDGARIALYRYRARGVEKRGEPVFLCHGLAASRYNLDFDDHYSWARRFAAQGFDAWVIDLRGAGLSTPARANDWTFDDYVRYDIPACVGHIREATGAEKVHWVGHSMGGMLLYAFEGTVQPGWVRSGVTMGSPVRFASTKGLRGILSLAWVLDYLPVIPTRQFTRAIVPLIPVFRHNAMARSQMNPHNVNPHHIQHVAYNAIYNLSPKLLTQFKNWVLEDSFASFDRSVNYQTGIRGIKVPIFVIAGSGDRLVQPVNVKEAFDLLPAGRNRYLEAGKQTGLAADYGHIDMVFGLRAHDEIFAKALQWVIDNDSVTVSQAQPV